MHLKNPKLMPKRCCKHAKLTMSYLWMLLSGFTIQELKAQKFINPNFCWYTSLEITSQYLTKDTFTSSRASFSWCGMDVADPNNIRFDTKLEPSGVVGDMLWYSCGIALWVTKLSLPKNKLFSQGISMGFTWKSHWIY